MPCETDIFRQSKQVQLHCSSVAPGIYFVSKQNILGSSIFSPCHTKILSIKNRCASILELSSDASLAACVTGDGVLVATFDYPKKREKVISGSLFWLLGRRHLVVKQVRGLRLYRRDAAGDITSTKLIIQEPPGSDDMQVLAMGLSDERKVLSLLMSPMSGTHSASIVNYDLIRGDIKSATNLDAKGIDTVFGRQSHAFSTDGSHLVVGRLRTIEIWQIRQRGWQKVASWNTATARRSRAIAIDHSGKTVAATDNQGVIELFSLSLGRGRLRLRTARVSSSHLPSICFANKGRIIATLHNKARLSMWSRGTTKKPGTTELRQYLRPVRLLYK